MPSPSTVSTEPRVTTFDDFVGSADYSLMDSLNPDPEATDDGNDHRVRQVFSGHYVPVTPTPLADPEYVAHSSTLFRELGLSDALAQNNDFLRIFSGDLSAAHEPMRPLWLGHGLCPLDLRQ